MHTLPIPTAEEQQRSAELCTHIERRIQHAPDQIISFSEYMEQALYTPRLGYYMTDHPIFGKEGDFITAPECSPLFAKCLARPCAQVLEKTGGNILEIGAGTGKLAGELLRALTSCPEHYYILEISPALRQRQQTLLQEMIPELYSRLQWLTAMPKNFSGFVIANEVIDALPADCFTINEGQVLQRGVGLDHKTFIWKNNIAPESLKAAVHHLQKDLLVPFFSGYHSEIRLGLADWIKTLADSLQSGVILLMDYGFERPVFYHPERSEGTLMCHYRQQAHDNPFWYPGAQDITTHVDFTAVAEAGLNAGLEVIGFSPQAHFLLACGLMDILQAQESVSYQMKQQIHWLTSPTEMGESFKVMGLAKGCDMVL